MGPDCLWCLRGTDLSVLTSHMMRQLMWQKWHDFAVVGSDVAHLMTCQVGRSGDRAIHGQTLIGEPSLHSLECLCSATSKIGSILVEPI